MATTFDARATRGPGAWSGNASLHSALRRGARSGPACLPGLHEGRGQLAASAPVMVVFVDHVDCPWLRLLRRGFRHCFVVFRAAPLWLACEALKDRIELHALDLPPAFDLARFYADQGHRVLLGRRPAPGPQRRVALAPLTCVTVVKRLLGIHAPWVWSPWQLYDHLCGPTWDFRPWSDPGAALGPATAHSASCARDSLLDIARL
jgi:hypothetical protein